MKIIEISNERAGVLDLSPHLDSEGKRLVLRSKGLPGSTKECDAKVLDDPRVKQMLSAHPPWLSHRAIGAVPGHSAHVETPTAPAAAPEAPKTATPEAPKTPATTENVTVVDEVKVESLSLETSTAEASAEEPSSSEEAAAPAENDSGAARSSRKKNR